MVRGLLSSYTLFVDQNQAFVGEDEEIAEYPKRALDALVADEDRLKLFLKRFSINLGCVAQQSA